MLGRNRADNLDLFHTPRFQDGNGGDDSAGWKCDIKNDEVSVCAAPSPQCDGVLRTGGNHWLQHNRNVNVAFFWKLVVILHRQKRVLVAVHAWTKAKRRMG